MLFSFGFPMVILNSPYMQQYEEIAAVKADLLFSFI